MKGRYERLIKKICPSPHKLFFFSSTDSTNLRAIEYIKSNKAVGGEVFVAKRQTAGRGTRQRSFYSDGGLYMSLIVRASDIGKNVTPMAAVCVCRAIDSLYGTDCKIKWVNDIWLSGKKLCGILCESCIMTDGTASDLIVIGIGINTKTKKFPAKIADIATSLYLCGHRRPGNARLLAEILRSIDTVSPFFMDEYKSRSAIIGRSVCVSAADGSKKSGTALGIDDDGALLLSVNGSTERIIHGDVFTV